MDLNRKYAFNLPWAAIVACTGCYVGLAVFMAHLAKDFTGAIFFCLVALSVISAVLAFIMLTRRLFFPRVLELSEDVILFPCGFPRTRIVRIDYADIISLYDSGLAGRSGIYMETGTGGFDIQTSYFPNIESYLAVRDFICSKAQITMSRHDKREDSASRTWRAFPDPILIWTEPVDWAHYRTRLYTSRPLLPRIAEVLWFFVRCFGIIVLPWLVLLLCGVPSCPAVEYLSLDLAVSLLFTFVFHWMNAVYPVHATEISFRDKGISQFFGKQTMNWNYHQISGWTVVERQFEGRVLLILLLQFHFGVRAIALPDTNLRDRVVQILHDKKIPQVSDLKPSWE